MMGENAKHKSDHEAQVLDINKVPAIAVTSLPIVRRKTVRGVSTLRRKTRIRQERFDRLTQTPTFFYSVLGT